MNVLIVDETPRRAMQIAELAREKKLTVVCCTGSNDFLNALNEGNVHAIALDVESWKKGKSIYGYLDTARKLADIPIVFYNAPEGFEALPDRTRLEKDAILPETVPVETVAESLAAA